MLYSVFFLFCILLSVFVSPTTAADPDFKRDVAQIISAQGYPVEQHVVQTPDGFVLGVQRIPGPKGSNVTSRYPVLVMHGLLDSSAAWVLNGPEQGLAFLLADAGFDVWLGNNRGNYYSRTHVKYTVDQKEFWDFSIDDLAKYDIPALVNYIQKMTGAASIGYAAHSQGTTQMFAALSMDPHGLGKKIHLFGGLAPVAYVGHQKSILISALAEFHLDQLFGLFGLKEFLPSSGFIHTLGWLICGPLPFLCEDFIFLLCGWDSEPTRNMNATKFPVYISHTPAGTSVKNMIHWASNVRSGKFQMFDYGTNKANMEKYNSTTPPAYNISRIDSTPMALFTGSSDALGDPQDYLQLSSDLPQSSIIWHHNEQSYQHLDFTWGIDAHQKVYADLIKLMKDSAIKAEQQAIISSK